jgi:anthranilate 1,2-dioxygenase small subunit
MVTAQTNYVVFRTMADPIDYGTTAIYSAGKYIDKIVWINEKPLFQEKIVVVDTARVQSLLVTPL